MKTSRGGGRRYLKTLGSKHSGNPGGAGSPVRSVAASDFSSIGKIQKVGKWVPHALTDEQQMWRYDTALHLLSRVRKNDFLSQIVTGDEKWIFYENPKLKKSYVGPRQPATPAPKRNIYGGNVFCAFGGISVEHFTTNFWNLVRRLRRTFTNNSLPEFRLQSRKKRPFSGEGSRKVKLLHDNARPHAASVVKTKIFDLGWELLPPAAYSADMAPSDYHLVRSMQSHLSGVEFSDGNEVEKWVSGYFASQSPQFYRDGIRKFFQQWQKTIDSNGGYFEFWSWTLLLYNKF